MGRSAYFLDAVRLHPARYEALLAFLLEAAGDDPARPFSAAAMEALRQAVPCDVVAYREWDVGTGYLYEALAGDAIKERRAIWIRHYPALRHEDPLPSGRGSGSPLPEPDRVGKPLLLSDVTTARRFQNTGLFAEICRPFGVQSIMKLFLPNQGSRGAAFVFDTSRRSFDEGDRRTLTLLYPHLLRLRRRAPAHVGAPHLTMLTPREQVVLGLAARGETNERIAAELFIGVSTVRKHLEHIYEKLDVQNRTAATAAYFRRSAARRPDQA